MKKSALTFIFCLMVQIINGQANPSISETDRSKIAKPFLLNDKNIELRNDQ